MRKALKVTGIVFAALILLGAIAVIIEGAGDDTATSTVQPAPATTAAAPAPTAAPATTAAPTTTAGRGLVIEDFYLAAAGDTYYVEISGVSGAVYCEAHLTGTDGRRTGEWSNELLDGSQDTATISLWDYDRSGRADGVEVECR